MVAYSVFLYFTYVLPGTGRRMGADSRHFSHQKFIHTQTTTCVVARVGRCSACCTSPLWALLSLLSVFIARDYWRESIHFGNVVNIRLSLMVRNVAACVPMQLQSETDSRLYISQYTSILDFLICKSLPYSEENENWHNRLQSIGKNPVDDIQTSVKRASDIYLIVCLVSENFNVC